MDPILTAWLRSQEEAAASLAAPGSLVRLSPCGGDPAHRYLLDLGVRGLVKDEEGAVREVEGFRIGITFPENYLVAADSPERPLSVDVLTYLGPHPRPWHPNIMGRPPYAICLHLRAGTGLVDIVHSCADLLSYRKWFTGDGGLNPDASRWALANTDRFPVDRRPLKPRSTTPRIRVTVRGGES